MLTLEQMTPEQKLGRVLCLRNFTTEDDIEFALEMAKSGALGAVQVPFNGHSYDPEFVKKFRNAADYPLILINDMELGFPPSAIEPYNFPEISMINLAATGNEEHIRSFAAITAKFAKEAGFSGCWGPIVDILHVNGPCRVSRTASDTMEGTLDFAREIMKVFASYQFHGTAKHFPGGQNGMLDTHMVEDNSKLTKEELLACDLVPYTSLMKEGLLPAIMVGHQTMDSIDPEYPSSMSKKVIGIIREAGFDGAIYTDSFAMKAILQTFGEKTAYVKAIGAGVDLILVNIDTPNREVYGMMLEAYKEGLISDERLDDAVRHVMALEQYCAKRAEAPYPAPENPREALLNIARDSITAECDDGVSPALENPEKKRLFVVTTMQAFDDNSTPQEISLNYLYNPFTVIDAIKDNFPNADVELIKEYPTGGENNKILTAATRYDEVVFVSFCATSSYYGTDCMTRRLEALINALIIPGKVKTLVHFGNPMAIEPLRHVGRKIFAYNTPAATRFAFEVLAGKCPAKGKIPYERLYKKN